MFIVPPKNRAGSTYPSVTYAFHVDNDRDGRADEVSGLFFARRCAVQSAVDGRDAADHRVPASAVAGADLAHKARIAPEDAGLHGLDRALWRRRVLA